MIKSLHRYFPMLADRKLEYAWGGPIDASATHLPHVVSLPSGRAFAAFGYTGNGVGPSQMVGRSLASLVLDRRDEYQALAFHRTCVGPDQGPAGAVPLGWRSDDPRGDRPQGRGRTDRPER